MKKEQITIRYLINEEFIQWDNYVSDHSDGSLFQTTVFIRASSEPLGRKVKVLCLFRDSKIIGGLAFASFRKMSLNIIPIPYECPVFHPLISERESKFVSKKESFYNLTLTLLLKRLIKDYDYFMFMFSSRIKDLRPYRSNGLKLETKYTYLCKVQKTDFQNPDFDPSTKRQIAKAFKNNYTVSNGLSTENINAFYSLLKETYSRQKIPLKFEKKDYINLLNELNKKNWVQLFVLRFGDKPAAAFAIPEFNKTAYYWISTSSGELSKLGAPSALLAEVINQLKRSGVKLFDLVGANTESVSRFKAGFNFELEYSNLTTYQNRKAKFLFGLKKLLNL